MPDRDKEFRNFGKIHSEDLLKYLFSNIGSTTGAEKWNVRQQAAMNQWPDEEMDWQCDWPTADEGISASGSVSSFGNIAQKQFPPSLQQPNPAPIASTSREGFQATHVAGYYGSEAQSDFPSIYHIGNPTQQAIAGQGKSDVVEDPLGNEGMEMGASGPLSEHTNQNRRAFCVMCEIECDPMKELKKCQECKKVFYTHRYYNHGCPVPLTSSAQPDASYAPALTSKIKQKGFCLMCKYTFDDLDEHQRQMHVNNKGYDTRIVLGQWTLLPIELGNARNPVRSLRTKNRPNKSKMNELRCRYCHSYLDMFIYCRNPNCPYGSYTETQDAESFDFEDPSHPGAQILQEARSKELTVLQGDDVDNFFDNLASIGENPTAQLQFPIQAGQPAMPESDEEFRNFEIDQTSASNQKNLGYSEWNVQQQAVMNQWPDEGMYWQCDWPPTNEGISASGTVSSFGNIVQMQLPPSLQQPVQAPYPAPIASTSREGFQATHVVGYYGSEAQSDFPSIYHIGNPMQQAIAGQGKSDVVEDEPLAQPNQIFSFDDLDEHKRQMHVNNKGYDTKIVLGQWTLLPIELSNARNPVRSLRTKNRPNKSKMNKLLCPYCHFYLDMFIYCPNPNCPYGSNTETQDAESFDFEDPSHPGAPILQEARSKELTVLRVDDVDNFFDNLASIGENPTAQLQFPIQAGQPAMPESNEEFRNFENAQTSASNQKNLGYSEWNVQQQAAMNQWTDEEMDWQCDWPTTNEGISASGSVSPFGNILRRRSSFLPHASNLLLLLNPAPIASTFREGYQAPPESTVPTLSSSSAQKYKTSTNIRLKKFKRFQDKTGFCLMCEEEINDIYLPSFGTLAPT
ncbi:Hypothetical predicted protein [Cloeon dipterum]|uniref:Uncharacterized protein n=1 Tax=Cloeon dipterum TaxID=197152 RepID=A0A8S1CAE0_9INSE|nr:Hypothetical predicted protein [Cloeon dipterum]